MSEPNNATPRTLPACLAEFSPPGCYAGILLFYSSKKNRGHTSVLSPDTHYDSSDGNLRAHILRAASQGLRKVSRVDLSIVPAYDALRLLFWCFPPWH